MSKSKNKTSIDIKKQEKNKEELKNANSKAKIEYRKQSVKNYKKIGITTLIVLIILVIVIIIFNQTLPLKQKNSVTFVVSDQNDNVVEGLILQANSGTHAFTVEFDKTTGTQITKSNIEPDNYILVVEKAPKNYNCIKIADIFTIDEDDQIRLEYKCTKENE